MKGRDKIFVLISASAFLLGFIPVIGTFKMINEFGVGAEGNPIHRITLSISPWLALLVPFIGLPAVYGMYRWSEDGGLVVAGTWLGIEISDSFMHLLARAG